MGSRNTKTLLVGGIVALAFLGGVAAAPNFIVPAAAQVIGHVASQVMGNRGGPNGGGDLLSTAAAYIGITESALRDELVAGKSLADVAVENGKTRDGLIAALTQAESDHLAQLVDQKGGFGPGGRPGPMVFGDPLATASTYLGMSVDDLRTKLAAGQSLGAIAQATAGKSRDGLIAALVTDATSKIDAAQQAGTVTADRATQLKAELTTKFTALVDATGGFRGGPGFPGGPGYWR